MNMSDFWKYIDRTTCISTEKKLLCHIKFSFVNHQSNLITKYPYFFQSRGGQLIIADAEDQDIENAIHKMKKNFRREVKYIKIENTNYSISV